ncbi:MAG: sigma-54-dependent Fis family transcriptional regulator [Gammaproteobacteria bacterium]|nr:sigma-54-dependent Fis family transcriptional regulator [Gammaproteobacteria bacterium]
MPPAHLERQHAQKISAIAALENESFERDLQIDLTIAQSWRRCVQSNELDPLRFRELNVVDGSQLRENNERFERLLQLAEPALIELAKSLVGTDYAVLLTDDRGVILKQLVEASIEREFRAAGLRPGADWGEAEAGTNGIGTCIVEKRPVTVHRDEHFLCQNIALTCSAAPIRDPHGNLLAVLDSSSCKSMDSRSSQLHTRALVATYAQMIESQHFLREYRNQKILRFQDRPELVALPQKALVALSEDNRVLAANDVTLQLLGIIDRAQIVGKELAEVIGRDVLSLVDSTACSTETIHSFREERSGRQFHGMIYRYKKPVRRKGLVVMPTSTAIDCRGELCELSVLAGSDPVMQEAARRARKVVDKRIPILIQGETGTGKDLFSQALHRASARRDKPFVALNCASIPESLIESELFGYKHGAFTGASRDGRRGKIIESSGGTLFLDEIGDMPLNMQSRLLRVLETQEVVPLGSEKTIHVELNIVSATHRDLRQLIENGDFREDLYYRLNGITIKMPCLRDRRDLNEIIMRVFEAENDTGGEVRILPDAMNMLLEYDWPGNLRQLRNVVRTAIALCDGGVVKPEDINLPAAIRPIASPAIPIESQTDSVGDDKADDEANPLNSAEHQVILASLNAQGWNISRTAEALDMSRNTLYRKMRKHGISMDRG